MSNAEKTFWCIVLWVITFGLGVSIGFSITHEAWQDDMKSRGLQEYDNQTGQLVWTEKAGGERK